MTDPYDVVAWKPVRSSVSGGRVSYWQEQHEKNRHSIYNRCLVFLYQVTLLLTFSALVIDVFEQMVRW